MLKKPLPFQRISNGRKQPREREQASTLHVMIIGKVLNFWPQNSLPRLLSIEVSQKVFTGSPDLVRVRVDGRENIEQMLNIRILRGDPSCFFESGRAGSEVY